MKSTGPTLFLNGGRRILPWQLRVLTSQASLRGIFGGFGSGKTTGAALALAKHMFLNPWTEEYASNNPETLIIGKTDKVIKDSSMRSIKQVLPKGMIRKEWQTPGERSMLLANGHLIKFRTWSGSIEGLSVTGAMLDEAHLLDDSKAFTNYIARVRDPLAVSKLFIVCGVPEFGWLKDTFGPGTNYPDSEIFHVSTYDNSYLKKSDIERIEASCTGRSAQTYLMGQWTTPEGAIFYAYDPAKHLIDDAGDRAQPVHLGIDVGNQGAIVFGQIRDSVLAQDGRLVTGKRLHIVDELLPDNMSMGQAISAAKQRGWKFKPGVSEIMVDPTTDRDEIEAINRELPGVNVVRRQRADEDRNREYGFRCVNSAFEDAKGNIRLTLSKTIPRNGRGLVVALPQFKRHELTGRPVKDNKLDHVVDSLRYLVAHVLPLSGRDAVT